MINVIASIVMIGALLLAGVVLLAWEEENDDD